MKYATVESDTEEIYRLVRWLKLDRTEQTDRTPGRFGSTVTVLSI